MEKKLGVPPSGGVSKSSRTASKGWLPPEKIKSRHIEKLIDCMVLKHMYILEISFPSLISHKPSEILIFRTFLTKFSILSYISLKISYFELGHD